MKSQITNPQYAIRINKQSRDSNGAVKTVIARRPKVDVAISDQIINIGAERKSRLLGNKLMFPFIFPSFYIAPTPAVE